jgi:Zn-dependent protease
MLPTYCEKERQALDFLLVPLTSLLAVVLGITIHEFSHALSAELLGDSTARYLGRLTLNPAAHFDPFGAIMILVSSLTGFGFGWGKPVPVNPYRLRFGPRVGMALTSFAGPFSNIVLATLFGAPLRLVNAMPPQLHIALLTIVSVNVALAVFNLLPVPPLDGFSVLQGLFGTIRARWATDAANFMDRIAGQGPLIFMLILFVDRALPNPGVIWTILGPLHRLLMWLILNAGA